jgi:dimethylaniline monooxygenase (N-oxide forming)
MEHRLDHKMYGLKPKHSPFACHPTVNDELGNRLASGTIIIKADMQVTVVCVHVYN